ncbi:uncharacterized protein [Excalfactoria chinensis]|uniref:uncharacterized protein n=1 Tax=Excalfactoria chinensis TaxID=46218 RepID=UPI003B3AAD2C
MDSVIKVVSRVCKTHCVRNVPSKKDIAAVISCLEVAQILPSPSNLLDSERWDSFTAAMLHRAMHEYKAEELKTWGLVLGALKAAKEEKQVQAIATGVFGLDTGTSGVPGGAEESLSGGDSAPKMAPATPAVFTMAMAAPETTPEEKAEVVSSGEAPPYYPRLYPSLQSFYSPEGDGICPREGESCGEARRGGVEPPPDPPPEEGSRPEKGEKKAEERKLPIPTPFVLSPEEGEERGVERKELPAPTLPVPFPQKGEERGTERKEMPTLALSVPPPQKGEEKEEERKVPPTPTQLVASPRRREEREDSRKPTDWSDIRESMRGLGLKERDWAVFPIVVQKKGPVWVPLEAKAVTRFIEAIEKKGLRSPMTMSTFEALMAPGPLLPYDIESLMRVVLEPVQFTVWKEEWTVQLKAVVAQTACDPNHPANGKEGDPKTSLMRLLGTDADLAGSAEKQLRLLRPGELLASTGAASTAFRNFVRKAEPVSPWSEIKQGPSETFSEFANRLIQAVEGSELPKEALSSVIKDCLKQKSHQNIRDIIRAAPDDLETPGEIIKYVLDKQQATPLPSDGLTKAWLSVMTAQNNQSKNPCFKCGQIGHYKNQCTAPERRYKVREKCQACGKLGHEARFCRQPQPRSDSSGKKKGTDKEPLLVPTRRTFVVSLVVCFYVFVFVTGGEGAHLMSQPENIWVTWSNRTGQKDFCLSLQSASSPFSTCLIGVPRWDPEEFNGYVRKNKCEKDAVSTVFFMKAFESNFTHWARMSACLIRSLNTSLPWDPPELQLLGSQSVGNVTWNKKTQKWERPVRCLYFSGFKTPGQLSNHKVWQGLLGNRTPLQRRIGSETFTLVNPIRYDTYRLSGAYCGFSAERVEGFSRPCSGDGSENAFADHCIKEGGNWLSYNQKHVVRHPNGSNYNISCYWGPDNLACSGCCARKEPLTGEGLWSNGTAKALPKGIFLICGDRAWQGIPKNPVGGPCYLGKLTLLAPNHSAVINVMKSMVRVQRQKRSIKNLDRDCGDEVQLWGPTARIFASILAPGVAAAQALREIERLACWSAKEANVTTMVLSELLMDINNIRHAVLQNRAAIDFLLLAQGHGCKDFEGMCCFNLSDHSDSIHKKLEWMQEHTKKIAIDDAFGSWLDGLFGNIGPWLKQFLKVLIIGILVFLALMICLPCVFQCIQGCLQRMIERIFNDKMECQRIYDKL